MKLRDIDYFSLITNKVEMGKDKDIQVVKLARFGAEVIFMNDDIAKAKRIAKLIDKILLEFNYKPLGLELIEAGFRNICRNLHDGKATYVEETQQLFSILALKNEDYIRRERNENRTNTQKVAKPDNTSCISIRTSAHCYNVGCPNRQRKDNVNS